MSAIGGPGSTRPLGGAPGATGPSTPAEPPARREPPPRLDNPALYNARDLRPVLNGERDLGRGDRGPGIKAVQEALIAAGFPLPRFGADGGFGVEAVNALTAFQRAKGLTPSGRLDRDTLVVLDRATAPSSALGSTGSLPAVSPHGTFQLVGNDPVRGPYRGEVTFKPVPGGGPNALDITYKARFKDGKEGSISGVGFHSADGLSFTAPLARGEGAFSLAGNPGAKPDASFYLKYIWDLENGNATGHSQVSGVPNPPGIEHPRSIEGIARSFAGIEDIAKSLSGGAPAGPTAPTADALKLVDDKVSEITAGVSIPLRGAADVKIPGADGLKITSPAGNTLRTFVGARDGGSPTVTIQLDKPIIVKGPWYQPDVEISTIWLEGDKVKTNARFDNDFLAGLPGIRGIPEKLANQAIGKVTQQFEPLARLLQGRARAGQLPDAEAIARSVGDALKGQGGGSSAEAMAPLRNLLDLSRANATVSATFQTDIQQPIGDVVVKAKAGSRVNASVPMDLENGRAAGELGIKFDPPVEVCDPGGSPIIGLASPEITGLRLTPGGRVSIDTDVAFGRAFFDYDAGREAARASALLTVLYQQIPADSELGQALRKMGVGPG